MTPELIGIFAMGVALAGLVLVSGRENARALRAEIETVRAEVRDVRAEIKDVRADIESLRGGMVELRERMARIEGMFEGFLRRPPRREPEPAAA